MTTRPARLPPGLWCGMDTQWRSMSLFAVGALAGGVVVVAAYLLWFAPKTAAPTRGPEVTAAAPQAAPAAAAMPSAALASSCPAEPMVAPAGAADGRFALQAVLGAGNHSEPYAFVAVAREAAGQGRMRDAEVALLAACHVAEQASGRASAPLADVKSQLGQHYVQLAARGGADQARDGLLQRASTLFADSASTYAATLGRNASKTRMAEERLATVYLPETLRAAQEAAPETATLGAAPLSSAEAGIPMPSLLESDPELAQLDYDLRRLQAQAASVSRDPDGLRRRDAQALAQRDARCQDKACLRQWYAQRRAQVLGEF